MDEMKPTGRGWLMILIGVTLALVLVATALLFLLVINKFTVEVRVNGPETVALEYGESYEERGASAVLRGSLVFTEGIGLDVRTEGTVPELSLGEFDITYTASLGPWSGDACRRVRVVDTQPPVSTLFTNSAAYTWPGHDYREEGYLAVDNYDGDRTDRVEVTRGDGVVTYTVTDSSGNAACVTRRIRYAAGE